MVEPPSYEEYSKWAQKQGIKTGDEFEEFKKANKLPAGYHKDPYSFYKKQGTWKGWGDFLGTRNTAAQDRKYRNLSEVKKFFRTKKFTSIEELSDFLKSDDKPEDIPADLGNQYRTVKGWEGLGDIIGPTYKKRKQIFRTVDGHKKLAKSLGITKQSEWRKYWQDPNHVRSPDIHADPPSYFQITWGEFTGSGRIAYKDREYQPYKKARIIANKLAKENNLRTSKDWTRFTKKNKKLLEKLRIPANPWQTYEKEMKESGGWGDWLGTGRIAKQFQVFFTFQEFSDYIVRNKIKSYEQYKKLYSERKLSSKCRGRPTKFYKKEWEKLSLEKKWHHPLAIFYVNSATFEQAKNHIRTMQKKFKITTLHEFRALAVMGKISPLIPRDPAIFYKKEWNGWGDFLGTGNVRPGDRQILPTIEAKIEARKLAKKYDIRTREQWVKAHREGKIPSNLPRFLDNAYNPKYRKGREK